MADNVAITAGSGPSIAADDISSVYFQRTKIGLGADGTAVDWVGGSGTRGTGTARVTIATDDEIVGYLNAMSRVGVVTASALTRPANTTAYTANDSVSNNATAGSVSAFSVTFSSTNDYPVTIERVLLHSTDTGVAGKQFRMWLYNADPTASSGVVGGDNAAFSNKKNGFIGCLSGTFRTFSDGSVAVLVPDELARIITVPTSGARTLYWQLQTLNDFTPSANSTTFTPTFYGFQGVSA